MQLLDLCGEWELRPARNGSAPPVPCTVPGGVLGARAAVEFAFAVLFAGLSALLLDRKVSL